MSRRTFPRAVAAGLIVAALGGPAAGQSPNPWRGESAAANPWRGESATPTAPAPRAVSSKPTRTLTIGVGFSSVGGLTTTIEVRDLTAATPATDKAPAVSTASTAPRLPPMAAVPSTLSSPRYLEHYPMYFPPDPVFPQPVDARPAVVRASYSPVPNYMPPPAPLPVQPIPPAAP
jgi:hypothetical protein